MLNYNLTFSLPSKTEMKCNVYKQHMAEKLLLPTFGAIKTFKTFLKMFFVLFTLTSFSVEAF